MSFIHIPLRPTIITDSPVASVFDYWGNDTVVSDMFSDNCPYFDASDVKDCENPSQQKEPSYQPRSTALEADVTLELW